MRRMWLVSLFLAGGARAELPVRPTARVAVEERYDDDRLLRVNAGGPGQIISKLSPEVGFELERRTLSANGQYAPGFMVRHGSRTFVVDHHLSLMGASDLSRAARVDARADVWRASDPTSLPRTGLARSLLPVWYGKAALSTGLQGSRRTAASLGYQVEGARVDGPGQRAGWVHVPSVAGWYRTGARNEVGAELRSQVFLLGGETAISHGVVAADRISLGPGWEASARIGPLLFVPSRAGESAKVLPRVGVELSKEHGDADLAVALGEDLIGASGFTTAIWAQYLSIATGVGLGRRWRIFGAASFFRNGRASEVGRAPWTFEGDRSSEGYGVGGGLEWEVLPRVRTQGVVDRYAQIGKLDPALGADVARNMVAVRVIVTAW